MEGYLSIQQTADKWGVCVDRVNQYIEKVFFARWLAEANYISSPYCGCGCIRESLKNIAQTSENLEFTRFSWFVGEARVHEYKYEPHSLRCEA